MLVFMLLYCFKYDWIDRVPMTSGELTWVAQTTVSWSESVSARCLIHVFQEGTNDIAGGWVRDVVDY